MDYDGDGLPDLAVQDASSGQLLFVTVATMKNTGMHTVTPTPQAGWRLVGPR
jgi:hypothetical protein